VKFLTRKFAGRLLVQLLLVFSFVGIGGPALGHGGGLDSDGGHNCYVGSCAGTYHCHQARGPGCGGGGTTYRAPTLTPSFASCVRLGSLMTRGEVRLMQLSLMADGFNPGPLDGYFGRRTSIAVNAYEIFYGLNVSPTQKIYFATLNHLGISC
jgi:hypothetical protein